MKVFFFAESSSISGTINTSSTSLLLCIHQSHFHLMSLPLNVSIILFPSESLPMNPHCIIPASPCATLRHPAPPCATLRHPASPCVTLRHPAPSCAILRSSSSLLLCLLCPFPYWEVQRVRYVWYEVIELRLSLTKNIIYY